MNTDYLTFYISHQLQTCVRVYTKEKQFIKMVPDYKENGARLSDYPKLEQFLLGASGAQPLISSVNSQLVFSLVTSPDNLYLIGPVYLQTPCPSAIILLTILIMTGFSATFIRWTFTICSRALP